jgi:pyruvate dehydrogenase E2 component (dihydrolipoamide acetyltransferase)
MDVIMPKVALTMTGGTIVEWYRQAGDPVRKGDPLFAFETDKSVIDVDAPANGVLGRILTPVGQEAVAGSVVAILDVAGEEPKPEAAHFAITVAPAAAELATALGVDLAGVTGSGTGGRILEGDVIAAASSRPRRPSAEANPEESVETNVVALEFSAARTASLPTLERSMAVPVFHLSGSIDFAPRWAAMKEHGLSVVDVLSIAAAGALRKHPTCHARMRGGKPETYVRSRIGILVRRGDALMPLVFDDPAAENAVDFHARRRQAQDAAERGRVASANAGTPTFVISNLGPFGVEWFTAMLYPDTSVTLALGALGGAGRAPTEASVVLTCDHRLADGVDAAQFMQSVRAAVLDVRIAAEDTE